MRVGNYNGGVAQNPLVQKLIKYKTQCLKLNQINNEYSVDMGVWEAYDQCEIREISFNINSFNWQFDSNTGAGDQRYASAIALCKQQYQEFLESVQEDDYNMTQQQNAAVIKACRFDQPNITESQIKNILIGYPDFPFTLLFDILQDLQAANIALATYMLINMRLIQRPIFHFSLYVNNEFYGYFSGDDSIKCKIKLTTDQYNRNKMMKIKAVLNRVEARFENTVAAETIQLRQLFQYAYDNQFIAYDYDQTWQERKVQTLGGEDAWCSVDLDACVLLTLFNN